MKAFFEENPARARHHRPFGDGLDPLIGDDGRLDPGDIDAPRHRLRGARGPGGPGFPPRGHLDFDRVDGPRPMPRGMSGPGMPGGHDGPHFPPHGEPGSPDPDRVDGPRCMPRGMGGPGGPGFPPHGGPGRPGGPGFPPHGGPGGPGFPPHRRPNPNFLKKRVEEADLLELIDMAGRMANRRPRGGAARSQTLILSILAGREALSQRELQQMLGIQPGSLSELLGKLESKGLIVREKAGDRRGNLLRITDAGRGAMAEADDGDGDDPLAPLSVDQQDQLAGLLRALLTGWIDRLELAPAHNDTSEV